MRYSSALISQSNERQYTTLHSPRAGVRKLVCLFVCFSFLPRVIWIATTTFPGPTILTSFEKAACYSFTAFRVPPTIAFQGQTPQVACKPYISLIQFIKQSQSICSRSKSKKRKKFYLKKVTICEYSLSCG